MRLGIVTMFAEGAGFASVPHYLHLLKHFRPSSDVTLIACLDGCDDIFVPPGVVRWRPLPGTPGIVRATKDFVRSWINFDYILRLTWDAQVIRGLPKELDYQTVYGKLRVNPCERIARYVDQMGAPGAKPDAPYVDGFCILAHFRWWDECYWRLPEEVTHYYDDSASSVYSALRGYRLHDYPMAIHQHDHFRHLAGCLKRTAEAPTPGTARKVRQVRRQVH